MPLERVLPTRSLKALDGLNFLVSELSVGLGPFMSSYLLVVHHWSQGEIGIALSAAGISTIILQAPAGSLIDNAKNKVHLLMLAALVMGGATFCVAVSTSFAMVLFAQVLFGAAGSILGPTINAVSLGLVGPHHFPKRVGRNEAFSHVGALGWTLVSGGIAQYYSPVGIYWLSIVTAIVTVVVIRFIKNDDISNKLAREAPENDEEVIKVSYLELLKDRRVLLLAGTFCLFHFANAPMLPLVGQYLSQIDHESWALYQSWCIVLSQVVMIPVAIICGKFAHQLGGRALMLVGCTILPLRGLLFTLSVNPKFILAVQSLDGIAMGIYGVVAILMIRNLSQGTGRFNAIVGLLTTAISLGAASSNVCAGFIAQHFSFNAAMVFLSAAAAMALGLLFLYSDPPSKVPA